jgi:NADH-quinone oxidoreductase subunit H
MPEGDTPAGMVRVCKERCSSVTLTSIVEAAVAALGLPRWVAPPVVALIAAVLILTFVLLTVLVLIYALRRILGFIQSRLGPNRVGPEGSLQTVADALKLLLKEDIIPAAADRWVFIVAPAIVFIPAFLVYVVVPFGPHWIARDLNIGIVYISAISSVAVIGIISGGWASNNKYALLGAMRSAAQMVSYEVPLVLTMLAPVVLVQTFSTQGLVEAQRGVGWFVLLQPVAFLIHLTASLAETNVTPFDIVEAESELVAGFHVEYSGMKFALFFLAEFANTFTLAAISATIFLGGWLSPFGIHTGPWWVRPLADGPHWFFLKSFVLVFVTMWIRGTLPRVRVDQLMDLGWKVLIPVSLVNLTLNALVVALGLSLWTLAAVNWAFLAAVVWLGVARRAVPKALRASK